MSFFLYRFIDSNENIIYIGRTNDIRRRLLKEHFSDNTHLPNECYLETVRVSTQKLSMNPKKWHMKQSLLISADRNIIHSLRMMDNLKLIYQNLFGKNLNGNMKVSLHG